MVTPTFEMYHSADRSSDRARTRARVAGLMMSGVAVVFLAFDAAIKLFAAAPAVESTAQLGVAPHLLFPIGLVEAACVILYLVPRAAPLGAVLLTGYLDGAVATHVRLESPLLSHTLFPIYVAALSWAGLWLRDPRIRALLRPQAAAPVSR